MTEEQAALKAILSAAADQIEAVGAWAQGATARDFAGREVEATSAAAMCWCACAAIDLAAHRLSDRFTVSYEQACAAVAENDRALIRFNDAPGRLQAEVVQALREAADRLTGAPE